MARVDHFEPVDVCLVLEGTYPYVAGGVSSWVHDLVGAQSDLTFHIVSLMPGEKPPERRYEVPDNVRGINHVFLQKMPSGSGRVRRLKQHLSNMEPALKSMQAAGDLSDVAHLLKTLAPNRKSFGRESLLNSEPAWQMLLRMYKEDMPESSFLDYFWTWRSLLGGLFNILLSPMPEAKVFHTVSTGYAGLFAARAKLETGRPVLLTEHGIYTNERRIEIAMADWLYEAPGGSLGLEKPKRDLKDLWIDTFVAYSRCCYQACDQIITLYTGNQDLQRRDGAAEELLRIIPNGVDYEKYSKVERTPNDRPTIALIGRVVPIKDVKTYIRAVALLRRDVPDIKALMMGPTDEDEDYYRECLQMVDHLDLTENFIFTGRVQLTEYLGQVDVMVLTSISEAQPLVILEGGAAGIPTVSTDVGACRDMLFGMPHEDPPLGTGGAITPLSNPAETAKELAALIKDPVYMASARKAIKERVRKYYNKLEIDRIYHDLYVTFIAHETMPEDQRAKRAEQEAA
ncbi:MAG: pellicle/biofilm biosynthesis glycosyltransferase PelF [Minwuia thermotolerans]|nr:MAG: pellicle/biofilm biosynthesis glycosyltransferase PelF [Minwuia thermotolerans]